MDSGYFNLSFQEGIQICSLLLALLTSVFVVKTFKRNRKQELENHLFKIKIEALSNLTYEMDNFFNILNRSIVQYSLIEKIENEVERHEQLLKLSLNTDEQLYKCHAMIAKYSVFFSKQSTQKLLDFSSNITGEIEENGSQENILMDYYQEQQRLADVAQTFLRQELKLETLNTSLHLRYK